MKEVNNNHSTTDSKIIKRNKRKEEDLHAKLQTLHKLVQQNPTLFKELILPSTLTKDKLKVDSIKKDLQLIETKQKEVSIDPIEVMIITTYCQQDTKPIEEHSNFTGYFTRKL
jgi:hypothetical protein